MYALQTYKTKQQKFSEIIVVYDFFFIFGKKIIVVYDYCCVFHPKT